VKGFHGLVGGSAGAGIFRDRLEKERHGVATGVFGVEKGCDGVVRGTRDATKETKPTAPSFATIKPCVCKPVGFPDVR
jgi:hypothetical protein